MVSSPEIKFNESSYIYTVENFTTTFGGYLILSSETKIDPIVIISPTFLWRFHLNPVYKSYNEFEFSYKLEILDEHVKNSGKHRCIVEFSVPDVDYETRRKYPSVEKTFKDLSKAEELSANFPFKAKDKIVEIKIRVQFYDGFKVEVTNPQSHLIPIVEKTLEVKKLDGAADFVCIVEGSEFKVHRSVLALWSPVFDRMFNSELKEFKTGVATLKEIRQDIFTIMLDIMYGKEFKKDLKLEELKALAEASHCYQIEELKASFEILITNELNESNAVELYEWAWMYDLDHLKAKAWHVINHQTLKLHLASDPLTPEEIKKINRNYSVSRKESLKTEKSEITEEEQNSTEKDENSEITEEEQNSTEKEKNSEITAAEQNSTEKDENTSSETEESTELA